MRPHQPSCPARTLVARLARRPIAVLLVCLLPLPASAQAPSPTKPPRVRITGASTYEVPGVIRLEGDRIEGRLSGSSDRWVQFERPGNGRVVTLIRPGTRLTGQALTVVDDLLEFVPDHETEHLFVPLSAISTIEISRIPASRAAWVTTGVFAGIGAFYLIFIGLLDACSDEGGCGGGAALFTLSIGGGTAVASAIASKGRARWQAISPDELRGLLAVRTARREG